MIDFLQSPAAYLIALLGVGFWAIGKGDEPLVRTFAVIVLNWVVLAAARGALHDALPVKTMLAVDFLSAVAILLPRVGTMQIVIGELFFAQVGFHTTFLAMGQPVGGEYFYTVALNVAGGLQVAALAMGAHHGSGKRYRLADWGGAHGGGAAGHAVVGARNK